LAHRFGLPNYQAIVATLLMAFATGKKVNLNIKVNSPLCAGIVNRLILKDYCAPLKSALATWQPPMQRR
jgi:hypothetical protein